MLSSVFMRRVFFLPFIVYWAGPYLAAQCEITKIGVVVEKIEAFSISASLAGFEPLEEPAGGECIRYRKKHETLLLESGYSYKVNEEYYAFNDSKIADFSWTRKADAQSHYGLIQDPVSKLYSDTHIQDLDAREVQDKGNDNWLYGMSFSWDDTYVYGPQGWTPSDPLWSRGVWGFDGYGYDSGPGWVVTEDVDTAYEKIFNTHFSDAGGAIKWWADRYDQYYRLHEKTVLEELDNFDAALDRAAELARLNNPDNDPPEWVDIPPGELAGQQSYMTCAEPADCGISGRLVKVDLLLEACPGKYLIKFEVISRAYNAAPSTLWSDPYTIEREVTISPSDIDAFGKAKTSVTMPKEKCTVHQSTGQVWAERIPDNQGGPGDETCGSPRANSAHMSWSLGYAETGEPLGVIELNEEQLGSAAAFSPASLHIVSYVSGSKPARTFSGSHWQLSAPSADIRTVAGSSGGYKLQFYQPGGTWSTLLTEWTVTPSSSYTQMDIQQTVGGSGAHHVFVDSGGQMTLIKDNLVEETLTETGSYGGGGTVTKTRSLRRVGQTNPDSVVAEVYQAGPTGPRLIQRTLAPGTSYAQISTWEYYTTTNTSTGALLDRLALEKHPDGSWSRYQYAADGTPTRLIRPWLNSLSTNTNLNAHEVQEFTTTDLDFDGNSSTDDGVSCETTITKILGQEVARSYRLEWRDQVSVSSRPARRVWEIQACVPGAAWNNASNLVTKTLLDWTTKRPWRIRHADGTAEICVESTLVNGDTVDTCLKGAPSGSGEDFTISAGVSEYTRVNGAGHLLLQMITDIQSGGVISRKQGVFASGANESTDRPASYAYMDGTTESEQYACCGKLESLVTRDGVLETFEYDALKRVTDHKIHLNGSPTSLFIRTHTDYDAAGNPLKITRYGTDVSAMVTYEAAYDLAGRRQWSKDARSRQTTYTYATTAEGGRLDTTTNPDGGTIINAYYRDGQRRNQSGSAVESRVAYSYSTDTSGLRIAQTNYYPSATGGLSAWWDKRWVNPLGQLVKEQNSKFSAYYQTYAYNAQGRLAKSVDRDGVVTLFAYDSLGNQSVRAISTDGDDVIDYDGSDRIARNLVSVIQDTGKAYHKTVTELWQASDTTDASGTLVSESRQRTDGLETVTIRHGSVVDIDEYTSPVEQIEKIVITYPTTGSRVEKTTHADHTLTIRTYAFGRLISQATTRGAGSSPSDILSSVTYEYDPHGRLWKSTKAGSGVTTYTYYADGKPHTVTTPDPGAALSPDTTDYAAQVTTYAYDSAGRLSDTQRPDGSHVYSEYYPNGKLKKTWGAGQYPVEYAYEPFQSSQKMVTMTTWRASGQADTKQVTTWAYDYATGLLNSKTDADGKVVTYAYTPAGRLKTRLWARGITTTYTYNTAGDLWTVVYSDGTTPSVTYTYDRIGQPATVADAAGLLTYSQIHPIDLRDEAYTSASSGDNWLVGLELERRGAINWTWWEALTRPGRLLATGSYQVDYHYDDYYRLAGAEQNGHAVDFGYQDSVGLLQSHAFRTGGVEKFTVLRTNDALGRLNRIEGTSGGAPVYKRDYRYNDLNQRTRLTEQSGHRWDYTYDALDQVAGGVKKQPGGTILAGYDFGYAYDDIGNRVRTLMNGRVAEYAADSLNRYISRDVPGAIDVRGQAGTSSIILVNDQAVTRGAAGEFHRALLADNGAGPLLASVKIQAVNGGNPPQVATDTRSQLLPASPEAFAYDYDGNLLQDGIWDYVWDGENRLKSVQTRADVASAIPSAKRRLEFAYDHQGRRIRKAVKNWVSGAWQTASDTRFLYDDWNLIAEYDALNSNALVRSHAWGPDLSGSAQGAGGVGGLLWTKTASTSYAPAYDGNGNIIHWIDLVTGSSVGTRDYSPVGEPIATTGVSASLPFGFSTKYLDMETGLNYYGFRYYNPSTGRWLSRDPIEEKGGFNLYGMVGNNPTDKWDYLGLTCTCIEDMYVTPAAPTFEFVPYDPSRRTWGIFKTPNGKYKVPFTFNSTLKHYKGMAASPATFTWTEIWRGAMGPWYALGTPGTYVDRDFSDNLTKDAADEKSMASVRDVPGMDLDASSHSVSKTLDLTIKVDGESLGICCKLKRWTMEITIRMEYDGATGSRVIGVEQFRTKVTARR